MNARERSITGLEKQVGVPLALPVFPSVFRAPRKTLAEPVAHKGRNRFRDSSLGRRLLLFCIIGFFHAGVNSAIAEPLDDTEAVEAGREALDGSVRFPWYDSSSDGIQRLDVEPPEDLKNRGSKWERGLRPQKTRTRRNMPAWLWTFLEILGWTVLIMLLAAVAYFLIRAFLDAESENANGEAMMEGTLGAGDVDRVENLPFQLDTPQTDLLSESRRHYDAGNYKQAIIYLYSYQLVELDRHQLIRLTKGKTNRQYLREMRRRTDLSGLLQTTMFAFEDVFFGNHSLERGRFESCWSGLDAFHQSLEQATA